MTGPAGGKTLMDYLESLRPIPLQLKRGELWRLGRLRRTLSPPNSEYEGTECALFFESSTNESCHVRQSDPHDLRLDPLFLG
jgi:hypothetical protein